MPPPKKQKQKKKLQYFAAYQSFDSQALPLDLSLVILHMTYFLSSSPHGSKTDYHTGWTSNMKKWLALKKIKTPWLYMEVIDTRKQKQTLFR